MWLRVTLGLPQTPFTVSALWLPASQEFGEKPKWATG